MPWTLACLAWPLVPFVAFVPLGSCGCHYVWEPLAGMSLSLAALLVVVAATRGKRPSEYTIRAILSVLFQVLCVAVSFLVWSLFP
jgi:hypothetical protein